MSRTATATPPPPYFPQRNATPTMRHCAVPTVSAVHFSSRHRDHHPKKKIRNAASSASHHGGLGSKQPSLGLTQQEGYDHLTVGAEITISPAASISSLQSLPIDAIDIERSIPTPSMTTSSSSSFSSTDLPTPSSSRAPSLHVLDCQPDDLNNTSIDTPTTASRQSWVPYLGKMAKAVVSTSFGFADKRKKSITPPVDAVFVPTGPTPQPTKEELEKLSEEAAIERRREWAMEQQRRVTECARLCSQWPHSGYNQSKWGPNGARTYYEPQSYANPQYVASLMARQADLERNMHEQSALVFTCRRSRASSEESEPSDDSYEWSLPSPTASMCLTADLSAAMASPLMSGPVVTESQVSLLSSIPSVGDKNADDLDGFARSIALDSTAMDIDSEPQTRRPFLVRPARAQSCGAKRPLTVVADEEEKRRKVDEAMVVEEAVETGVMMPQDHRSDPPLIDGKQMSASVPDLSANNVASGPSIFGHIVKTSDTHPIIISPFFPVDIIPTIAEAIVIPAEGLDASPLQLGSKIDVPSLLLAQQLPHAHYLSSIVPSPVKPVFDMVEGSQHGIKLGNLLLSSCPGKRLRMEGPVKGRGPVCRDLATDLRRIKNEGVGCLVCCLDDPELALLGVPWETYSQVAMETGLDVIRLPMPDGFTPVSLSLFDNQVSLIVKQYSLRGINVLVHCRGGVGRAGLTASAWAIKMGFVPPHPSLSVVEEAAVRQAQSQTDRQVSAASVELPIELEHQITMSIVERVIAMIRARRGLKAIESFEQVQFLASYVRWLRSRLREEAVAH